MWCPQSPVHCRYLQSSHRSPSKSHLSFHERWQGLNGQIRDPEWQALQRKLSIIQGPPLPKNTQPPLNPESQLHGRKAKHSNSRNLWFKSMDLQAGKGPMRQIQGEICHRALEDQPALQGLKDVYLAFNTSQSHQHHLCVTVTTTSHPTLLMVPESISPLRTEGEATGTAVGKSRKNTKSLTFLELLLPPVYKENTRFISGVRKDYKTPIRVGT